MSSPVFTNCVIADNTLMSPGGSFAAGIYARYQTYPQFTGCIITRNTYFNNAAIHLGEVSNPTFTNCLISDNKVGFRFVSDATATVSQCSIVDNSLGGVVSLSSSTPNCSNNWWGNSTGPQHTANPGGTGDLIDGTVVYTPWLNQPNLQTPPLSPTGLNAEWTMGSSGYDITVSWNPSSEANVSYVVHYGLDSLDVVHPNSVPVTGTSVVVQALQTFAMHYFQVYTVRAGGTAGWFSATDPVFIGEVANDDPQAPNAPAIVSAYPNPFSQNATISYTLKIPGVIILKVFNLKGQLVRELLSAERSSGEHQVLWDGTDLLGNRVANGIYLLELCQEKQRSVSKLMLAR